MQTGLISWLLSTGWQRMPEYALLEALVYSTYGLLGSGNCNNGLLQKILLYILMLVGIYLSKQMVYFSLVG